MNRTIGLISLHDDGADGTTWIAAANWDTDKLVHGDDTAESKAGAILGGLEFLKWSGIEHGVIKLVDMIDRNDRKVCFLSAERITDGLDPDSLVWVAEQ